MNQQKPNSVLLPQRLKLNLSFYILYGLHHDSQATCNDQFLRNKRTWNKLVQWIRQLSSPAHSAENILGMAYAGWKHFNGKDMHAECFSNTRFSTVIERYRLDAFRLLRCMLRGADQYDWYEETHASFVSLMPDYDIGLFVKLFAITSPQSHPASNFISALEAYDCLVNREKSILQMKCFDSVRNMLLEIETDTFDDNVGKATRRKVVSFMNAINGDDDAVVVDSHMLNACSLGKVYFWKSKGKFYVKCRKREYDLIEFYIRALATVSGFQPRQLTAMAWAGVRIIDGRYKIASMDKVIKKVLLKNYA